VCTVLLRSYWASRPATKTATLDDEHRYAAVEAPSWSLVTVARTACPMDSGVLQRHAYTANDMISGYKVLECRIVSAFHA
jgi:hypothetical protein